MEKADMVERGHGRGRGHGHGHGHKPKFIFQPFSAICSVGQKGYSLAKSCLLSLLNRLSRLTSSQQRSKAMCIFNELQQ